MSHNAEKRLKRACSVRRRIQNLVDLGDFDGLLQLHKDIYDVERELPPDDKTPTQCHTPSYSKEKNQARFLKRRRKQHIDIFYDDLLNVTICLPPKVPVTIFIQNKMIKN